MEITPSKEQDSGHGLSSDSLSKVFKSTPKDDIETTPHLYNSNLKKRKISYCDIRGKKLDDLLERYPCTPQASSTLNESLTREFESIKIEQNILACNEPASKLLKTNGCERLETPPSTPESHYKAFELTPRKKAIFPKCSSACSVPSPLKEQHDILYPNLTPLDPLRKTLTPQKFKEKLDHNSTHFKASFFASDNFTSERKLLNKVINNDVVMAEIFKFLSNGDLFRFSMVSKGFRDALYKNLRASQRYLTYQECHKKNKENYKITPPSSPENQYLFPAGSVSPNSRKFVEFVETGHQLNPNQSLIKCPKCGKPSIVEKSIAQCQEVISCGFIFCQKCDCFAYNPEEFYDKCQDLILGSSQIKVRPRLEDLTNYSADFNASSFLNSTSENHYHSSGYFSGYDTSHTPLSVKRNLSMSFSNNESQVLSMPPRALFDSNRSVTSPSILDAKEEKKMVGGGIIPIVKSDSIKRRIEIDEPSSPPKVKMYSACSKASRRSLKRLTR